MTNRFTPTWKNAGVEADIISLQKQTENYRIRIKINGKYYVGHLEKSE